VLYVYGLLGGMFLRIVLVCPHLGDSALGILRIGDLLVCGLLDHGS